MSFKYRFIVSFVLLEVFFILLIVSVNFVTINNSSKQLIKQKLHSNISFLKEMIIVPISIYDLASLDNLVEKTVELDYINSIVILDAQDRVVSKQYNYDQLNEEALINSKKNDSLEFDDHTYEIRYDKIMEGETLLGSLYVVFDTSDNFRFINKNKKNTAFIILIEILISTYLSYLIGSRLTTALEKLSDVAEEIGENKQPQIPFQERKDELGTLSKSMNQMQIDLKERSGRLEDLALELNRQKNELIEANKSKDDFLANMSHELKTPLNSINVISSVMMKNKKNELNENQVKNLSIINGCGNDLLFLINDVLDISKLEAGEIELVQEPINFKETMHAIKEMFEPQVKAKGLDFVFEFDETIDYIYSDEQRIKQIVKNLLSNALKFVENGLIQLRILDHNNFIKIEVEDDGIGIPEDKLENIFDRFKQVDGSTSRKYGGTGLGLAICKELSVLLGGDISVRSKEGLGTCFMVTFKKNLHKLKSDIPLEIEENPTATNEKSLTQQTNLEVQEEPLNIENILILNDDPVVFLKLIIELKKEYQVIQADKIASFLETFKTTNVDLAIVDTSYLSHSSLLKVVNALETKFILIYENELDNIKSNKIIFKVKKPIDTEYVITQLQEIKGASNG